MKNVVFLLMIIWFVLGASAANERGFFDPNKPRSCSFIGSASLTVIAGPLGYAGVHPKANC